MIIRITGICLIIICCFLSGIKASDRLKRYCESCNMLEEFLNRISIMIRYRNLNVYSIISELKKSESLSGLEFIKNLVETIWNGSHLYHYTLTPDNELQDKE